MRITATRSRLTLCRQARRNPLREKAGAGEGNRTLVFSLEGCCSTIELHPRQARLPRRNGHEKPGHRSAASVERWWRGLDSNQRRLSQRIYSPSPLTTRAPLRTGSTGVIFQENQTEIPRRQGFRCGPCYGDGVRQCQPEGLG